MITVRKETAMNVVSKVEAAVGRLSVAWLSLAVRYPMAYLVTVAFIGVLSLIVFFAPEASAQLETQVTTALNPLARLLVGPIAKGLAVIGLFAFVGLLYAGRWMGAVSSLVAAVILGLLANIVTAIFQGSTASTFTLG
jgi:type IV secretory pathway VirB2 component (pilin)